MKANRAISILTAALVFLLAVGAFVLSYQALRAMAAANGIAGWQSYIWPLLVDFALITFSLAVVRASLQGERTAYPWLLVSLYTVATIAFNVLHAPANITAQVIAAVAPVSLFLSFELLMSQLKTEVRRHNATLTLQQLTRQVSDRRATVSELEAAIEQKAARLDTLQGQIDDLNRQRKALNAPIDTSLTLANDTRRAQMLARREQVLILAGQGLSQSDIASELEVSLATIKRDTKALNGKVQGVTV